MTVTENRRDYLESLYQDMSIKELRTLAAERTPDVKSRSKQAYAEALLTWHIAREEQAPVETTEPVDEDDELSPSDLAAIDHALAQPDMGPFSMAELEQMVMEGQQKLADRLAALKTQVKTLNHGWANVISHAVPYDLRTYSDECMTYMHLDYIEKYLALPLCFRCNHIHTSKQCPRCHKPLCGYCEYGTLDMRVNACPECALVLKSEQEQESQPEIVDYSNTVPLREAVNRLDTAVKRLVENAELV